MPINVRATVQSLLQQVPAFLGETWTAQRLTSGPASQAPRTYGTGFSITVIPSQRQHSEEYDQNLGATVRKERQQIRMADNAIATELHQGDQVTDPTGAVWAVMGMAHHNARFGTVPYMVERITPLAAGPDRHGGV